MKKLFCLITLLSVFFSSALAFAAGYGEVTTGELNIRDGIGTKTNVLTTVKYGERVILLDDAPQDGWYRVQTESGDVTGYANGKFLNIVVDEAVPEGGGDAAVKKSLMEDFNDFGIFMQDIILLMASTLVLTIVISLIVFKYNSNIAYKRCVRREAEEEEKKRKEELRLREEENRRKKREELYKQAMAEEEPDFEKMLQAAKLGHKAASSYVGKQMFMDYSADIANGNITNSERESRGIDILSYLNSASDDDANAQFMICYLEFSCKAQTLKNFQSYLDKVRKLQSSGKLDKFCATLSESLIPIMVDQINGMSKRIDSYVHNSYNSTPTPSRRLERSLYYHVRTGERLYVDLDTGEYIDSNGEVVSTTYLE